MPDRKRRIDRILEASFLEGLQKRPLAEVRTMRADATVEEGICSYERRLLHGRLAILRKELDHRVGKESGSLIEELPQILSDEGRGESRGAFPAQDPVIEFT